MKNEDVANEQADEAEVVSLDQIREKRRQREEAAQAAAAEAHKKLFQLEQDLQRHVLYHALASRRMLFADFTDMIKLGIITDAEDHLPCQVHSRNSNYREWVAAYYGEEAADPDEDLIDELVEQLQKGGVSGDSYEMHHLTDGRKKQVPAANTVFCPLLMYGENEPPPCKQALLQRYTTKFEDGQMKHYHILPDPEDPVMKANLYPCVFLGKELFRVVMPGAWKVEAEEYEEVSDEADDEAEAEDGESEAGEDGGE